MKLKIRNIYNGTLLAAGLMLTLGSCVEDNFESCGPLPWDEDADTYIAFRFVGATNTTRAADPDLENGTHNTEHRIGDSGNYVFFFNKDGKYVNAVNLKPGDTNTNHYSHDDGDSPIDDDSILEENEEAVYTAKYKVIPEDFEAEEGQLLGFCVVILNGQNITSLIPSLNPGDDISTVYDKIVWSNSDPMKIGHDGSYNYFTMTNSVYASGNTRMLAQPFTSDVIQDAENDFDWGKSIKVPVERMLSKVSVDFNGGSQETVTSGDETLLTSVTYTPDIDQITVFDHLDENGEIHYVPKKWKAKITGWNMNALEKESFLFKNIDPSGNYFSEWNNSFQNRSYWAEDPHYDITGYPWQFRRAVDVKNVPFYNEAYSVSADFSSISDFNILKNYPYTSLNDSYLGKAVYIPENTYDSKTVGNLDNRTNVIAGSHLIITANLETTIFGSDYSCKDVFRDINGVFYKTERECFVALLSHFVKELNSQSHMRYRYYDWGKNASAEGQGKQLVANITGNYFDHKVEVTTSNGQRVYKDVFDINMKNLYEDDYLRLYYNGTEVTAKNLNEIFKDNSDDSGTFLYSMDANIKNGDGKRLIWIKGLEIKDSKGRKMQVGEYIDGQDGSYPLLDPGYVPHLANYREASDNDLISMFYDWLGAIDHFKDGRMYYYVPITHFDNHTANNKTDDVFGAVRNHWYKFGIVGVNEIGTPVDNEKEPIVPNKVGTKDRLNFRVEILDWHYVFSTETGAGSIDNWGYHEYY